MERIFFFAVVILNLMPVLSVKLFTTLDGPSHLYNAQLIKQLASGNTLHGLIVFNSEPVPNWTGHFIMAVSDMVLPAYLSEKVLFLFYLIGLPLAFRALVRTISPGNAVLLSYLIFPFTYSAVFFFGFFNFCVALVFLLITLNFWINNHHRLYSRYTVIKLLALLTLIYFSHVSVFVLALALAALYYLLVLLHSLAERTITIRNAFRTALSTLLLFLIAAAFPLILALQYFLSRTGGKTYTYIPRSELTDWLFAVRPATALNVTDEEPYSKVLFYALVILIAAVILTGAYRLFARRGAKKTGGLSSILKQVFSPAAFWLYAAVIVLFLFFTLPDGDGKAGIVSMRLCLLFFLLLILWIATQRVPVWLGVISVAMALYSTASLHSYRMKVEQDLGKIALSCYRASEQVEANSVVYSANYTDNWLLTHYNSYLGIDKPVIVFDNYECRNDFFPLRWNNRKVPGRFFRFPEGIDSDDAIYQQYSNLAKHPETQIDYLFVIGDINNRINESREKMQQEIALHYTLSYSSDWCKLYKRE